MPNVVINGQEACASTNRISAGSAISMHHIAEAALISDCFKWQEPHHLATTAAILDIELISPRLYHVGTALDRLNWVLWGRKYPFWTIIEYMKQCSSIGWVHIALRSQLLAQILSSVP
jgi:hypothetical protein